MNLNKFESMLAIGETVAVEFKRCEMESRMMSMRVSALF